MKRFFLWLLLLCCGIATNAQNWQWAKNGGDSSLATSIVADEIGMTYVTGIFSNTLSIDTINLQNVSTKQTVFLSKFNTNGNCIWAKTLWPASYNSAFQPIPNVITIDKDKNIYITGNFSDSFYFSNGFVTSIGYNDIFIAKLDSNGNRIWIKTTGSADEDMSNSICYSPANNRIYIAGGFGVSASSSIMYFDNGLSLVSQKWGDAFIACYSTSGSLVWAKAYGALGGEEITGISSDSVGDLHATGFFDASTKVDSIQIQSLNMGFVLGSVYVATFDSIGNVKWTNSIGGIHQGGPSNGNSMSPAALQTDKWGNTYIYGGYFGCKIRFSNNGPILSNNTAQDGYYLAKYGVSGGLEWAKNSSNWPSTFIWPSTITLDYLNQNIYLTGSFNYVGYFATDTLTSSGSQDVYILKYDSHGNEVWGRSVGGPGLDNALAICTDTSNGLYIVGGYNSSIINFGPDSFQNSGNKEDMFVAKMGQYATNISNLPSSKSLVYLYPNPNTGSFLLDYRDKRYEELSITDISRREVYHQRLNTATKKQINLNLPDGLYFIRLTGKGESAVQKFIVQH